MRWAVYISSNLDFSHADSLKDAAHEMRAAVDGQENSSRLDPALFIVTTLEYLRGGTVGVARVVTDPRTWTN
jgi:hypothetical protein